MDVRSENASVLLLGTWTNNIFIMSFNLGNFRRRSTDLLPHLTMAENYGRERVSREEQKHHTISGKIKMKKVIQCGPKVFIAVSKVTLKK